MPAIDPTAIDLLAVALLGGLLSVGELVSRYRDEPVRALTNRPGLLYIVINVAAAIGALAAARLFGWSFGVNPANTEQLRWAQVLAAGLGAMALFRSSLINVRVSGQGRAGARRPRQKPRRHRWHGRSCEGSRPRAATV